MLILDVIMLLLCTLVDMIPRIPLNVRVDDCHHLNQESPQGYEDEKKKRKERMTGEQEVSKR